MRHTPHLEVIDVGAPSAAHPVPLLFIHGAWHGAWCWRPFLDFFGERGYRAVAMSLRGHGASPTSKKLRWCSLADYIDDVRYVARTLPSPPVLVGHSLGGFIVQKYLETEDAPAGVLIASAPPQGSLRLTRQLMRSYPALMARGMVTGDILRGISRPEVARALFFSADTDDAEVGRYAALLCNESQRVSLDTMFLNRPRPERVRVDLLVLGGRLDNCVTEAEVEATARAYRTTAEFFDSGHNMMLERDRLAVAQRIDAWLSERGL